MDFYTLDDTFHRKDTVDKFISAIWTERYTKAGDATLTVDASGAMIEKLKPGTFLALEGSKEVMLLETREIKDGLLTVSGYSLLEFLKNRVIRVKPHHSIVSWEISDKKPGELISFLVQEMAINGAYLESNNFSVDPPAENLTSMYGPAEKIHNLFINEFDETGDPITMSVPFGPLYPVIEQIADSYGVGMKLYLDRIDPFTDAGVLHFETYKGVDRTSVQEDREVVRFSPAMESLADVKELHSMSGYKNVCYAYLPALNDQDLEVPDSNIGIAWEGDPDHPYFFYTTMNFKRRTMMITVDDMSPIAPEGMDPETYYDDIVVPALRQKARDALANNNYTKMLDGEVVTQVGYTFGVDYNLGDLIELEGLTGIRQAARITEYTRAEDSGGEKPHPTVSVI